MPAAYDAVPSESSSGTPTAPAPRRRRTRLRWIYLALGAVAVCLVVVVAVILRPPFPPMPSSRGGTTSTPHSVLVYSVQNHTFGPGLSGNVTIPFSIPPGSQAVFLTGNLTITSCASPGDDCLAYVAVFTPANWANYQQDRPSIVVWCYSPGTGTCEPAQHVPINGTDDLTPYSGATLDLCLWSNSTVGSQMFTADATLHYTTIAYHT